MVLKIQISQMNAIVADIPANLTRIVEEFEAGGQSDCDLVVCPEMCLTGYPIDDIILWPILDSKIDPAIEKIQEATKAYPDTGLIIGTPFIEKGKKYNSALLIQNGEIIHIQHKRELPNYGVFDEKRLFSKGPIPHCFMFKNHKIGLMICEDLWLDNVPKTLGEEDPDLFISLNGSPYYYGHFVNRLRAIQKTTSKFHKTFVYVNQVGTQDELVFDGHSFVIDGNCILKVLKGFREDRQIFTHGKKHTTIVKVDDYIMSIDKTKFIYKALTLAVKDFCKRNGFTSVLLGLSGGMDSALTAMIAADALGSNNVHAVILPSPFTSDASLDDAQALASNLGITLRNLPISDSYALLQQQLGACVKAPLKDTTDQNLQARLRGLFLMGIANQEGHLLLTTGNKSEIAVGYCTLYGDMCGGYNPLKDIYKTTVYDLALWRNRYIPKIEGAIQSKNLIPLNIITKDPSAELKADQCDQDSLPDYSILDEILIDYIDAKLPVKSILKKHEGDEALVKRVIQLIHQSEFKRQQSAPGPKVTSCLFGKDWRWPISYKS